MRHSLFLLPALILAPAAAHAAPGDVNAQEFYLEASELMDKGMAAMFDKRTKPRMAQLRDAGERAKVANDAAVKRGKPIYCVSDAQRKKGLNPQMAMRMLGAVPEAQRKRSTLAQAWRAALVREYPCG